MAGNRLGASRRVEGLDRLVEGMDQGEHRVRVQTRLPTAHVFALMAEYCIRRVPVFQKNRVGGVGRNFLTTPWTTRVFFVSATT